VMNAVAFRLKERSAEDVVKAFWCSTHYEVGVGLGEHGHDFAGYHFTWYD